MNEFSLKIIDRVSRTEKHLRKSPTECLYPTCSNKAIRSHSQQKQGSLSYIAEKGHVIGVSKQVAAPLYHATPYSPPPPRIDKIGLRDASTFWGYCNEHDAELFECIEKKPLQKGMIDQVFAIHLRALSHEMQAKRAQLEIAKQLPFYGEEVKIRKHLLDADLKWHWDLLWRDDKLTVFEDEFLYEWRVIPGNVGVTVTTMIPPLTATHEDRYMTAHKDINGVYDVARPAFSFSIIITNTETHIIMCWHKDNSDFVSSWRKEFLAADNKQLATFLNKCVFVMSEDYYVRPSLWDSLSQSVKELVSLSLYPSVGTAAIPNVITL